MTKREMTFNNETITDPAAFLAADDISQGQVSYKRQRLNSGSILSQSQVEDTETMTVVSCNEDTDMEFAGTSTKKQ